MNITRIAIDINDAPTDERHLALTKQATETGNLIHLVDSETGRSLLEFWPLGHKDAPNIGCVHARFSVIVTDCYSPLSEQQANVWAFSAEEAIDLALKAAGFSSIAAWAAETDHDVSDIRAEIRRGVGGGKPVGTVKLP